MTFDSPITDVDWLFCLDPMDGDYGRWAVEALLDSGYTVRGSIMGDGIAVFDAETFEEDGDLL